MGIYSGPLGFGYNTELLAKKKLPVPKTWADLLKPEYKGEIQVANPASSGTAYTMIATLVQLMGEDKAFDYMKGLHKNISQYTRSGTGPIKAVARGETAVSISFVHDGPGEKMQGFPVETITPAEGTGAEIGSMSIIKGARNLEAAKKFYEWALTPQAQQFGAAAKQFQLPSQQGHAGRPARARLQEDQVHQLRLRQVRRQRRAPPPDRALGEGSQLAAALKLARSPPARADRAPWPSAWRSPALAAAWLRWAFGLRRCPGTCACRTCRLVLQALPRSSAAATPRQRPGAGRLRHGKPWLWCGARRRWLCRGCGAALRAGRAQGRALVGRRRWLGACWRLLAGGFTIGAKGWSFEALEQAVRRAAPAASSASASAARWRCWRC